MKNKKFFYQSFLNLENEAEVKRYLRDLLTLSEINEFSERLWIARMLNNGMTYQDITRKMSASSTTIARVSKWLKKGRDGYKLVLTRVHHHQSDSAHL